jgi:hypothetical protein
VDLDQRSPAGHPQRWLWVTGPDYYLDERGEERRDLEPDVGFVPDGWWTCAAPTKAGDLVLLYRSRVKKDVAHLLVARSDAVALDMPDSPFHGKPVCQYEVITKFRRPVAFSMIANDGMLRSWVEVRRRFVRSGVPVPDRYWQHLFDLAGENRVDLEQQAVDGLRRYRYERDVQDWLYSYPGLLAPHGLRNLTAPRRELFLAAGSRADLVFRQGAGALQRTVVIELKRGVVGPGAVDQVLRYRQHLARDRRSLRGVVAVLIGTELHPDAAAAARRNGVRFIALGELHLTRASHEPMAAPPGQQATDLVHEQWTFGARSGTLVTPSPGSPASRLVRGVASRAPEGSRRS